jgi:hypothetical protein
MQFAADSKDSLCFKEPFQKFELYQLLNLFQLLLSDLRQN